MLKAIIIDDEESNISSLRHKLNKHCENVEVIAECENAVDGITTIDSLKPDIVFLDIEMPVMNGFVMLQHLTYKNFALVFVTAYNHYAIKAIRYSALDYLVKPIEIEDLQAAVARASEKKVSQRGMQIDILLENLVTGKKNFKRLAVPTLEGIMFIKTTDIIYLAANVNYTHIHVVGKKKYKYYLPILTVGIGLSIFFGKPFSLHANGLNPIFLCIFGGKRLMEKAALAE